MAWRLKSPAPLLLLAGVLSLLTVSASGQYAIVTFVMTQHAEMGQLFKIVGNSEELGNWTPGNVENMTWTPGDAWVSSTTLTKGGTYEYKAVVVSSTDARSAVCYMPDDNRVLTVPEEYANSHYVETVFWKVSCGYDCHSTSACAVRNE